MMTCLCRRPILIGLAGPRLLIFSLTVGGIAIPRIDESTGLRANVACVLNERGYGILRASEDVVIPPHETIMIRTCREGSLNGEIRCLSLSASLLSSAKEEEASRENSEGFLLRV